MNKPEPWDPEEWEDIIEILPRIQVEDGNLEFHETPEESVYRITQQTKFRIPEDLLAGLTGWQLDLLQRMMESYQEETREQLHAATGHLGRTGRAYIAPKGADPDDPTLWQDIGHLTTDGLTVRESIIDEHPLWIDETHNWRDLPSNIELTLHNISDETRDLLLGPPAQWKLHTPTWRRDPLPLEPVETPLPRSPRDQRDPHRALLLRLRWYWEPTERSSDYGNHH